MDREAWSATVQGVAKSRTRLSDRNELRHPFPYLLFKREYSSYSEGFAPHCIWHKAFMSSLALYVSLQSLVCITKVTTFAENSFLLVSPRMFVFLFSSGLIPIGEDFSVNTAPHNYKNKMNWMIKKKHYGNLFLMGINLWMHLQNQDFFREKLIINQRLDCSMLCLTELPF